jgi:proline iminopeptidase
VKKLLKISLILFMVFGFDSLQSSVSQDLKKDRETVLDQKVEIHSKLVLDVPEIPRWCDRLDLTKHRININGCELYVEEQGQGIPLVLLHGGPGSTHHYFHPHFSRAKNFARVIYYDQRGCGLSDYKKGKGYTVDQAVGDIEGLRKALGLEKIVLLGHSYGGILAQKYSVQYPENIKGLILVDSGLATSTYLEPTRQYDYMSEKEKERIDQIFKEVTKAEEQGKISPSERMEVLVYNRLLNGDWKRQNFYKPTPEQMARYATYEWKHDQNFNQIMSAEINKIDLKGAFDKCPIPTLIIEGKRDLTWNIDKPEKLSKNHPHSRMILFENSGHNPFMDEPDKFFNILQEFLKDLPKISSDRLSDWKQHIAKWEKSAGDPLLKKKMSPEEKRAIKKFYEIREKVNKGLHFEKAYIPLEAFLTFYSCVYHKDKDMFGENSPVDLKKMGVDVTDTLMEMQAEDLRNIKIYRAPMSPKDPKQGDLWPVYVQELPACSYTDTHVFVFWNGKWMRIMNIGNASDWRESKSQIQQLLKAFGKKRPAL